jgi:hypothetical protein
MKLLNDISNHRIAIGFSAVITITSLVSCSAVRTKAPLCDTTAPILTWVVIDEHNRRVEISGSGGIEARRGEHFLVKLQVSDPEGVHEISLSSMANCGCRTRSSGRSQLELREKKGQTFHPDENGDVLTSTSLPVHVEFAERCPRGWDYTGGSRSLKGVARNYYDGRVEGNLVFNVSE